MYLISYTCLFGVKTLQIVILNCTNNISPTCSEQLNFKWIKVYLFVSTVRVN